MTPGASSTDDVDSDNKARGLTSDDVVQEECGLSDEAKQLSVPGLGTLGEMEEKLADLQTKAQALSRSFEKQLPENLPSLAAANGQVRLIAEKILALQGGSSASSGKPTLKVLDAAKKFGAAVDDFARASHEDVKQANSLSSCVHVSEKASDDSWMHRRANSIPFWEAKVEAARTSVERVAGSCHT